MSSHCVEKSVTIDKAASEIYAFWRNAAHLPQLMPHLREVRELDDGSCRWVGTDAFGATVEWKVDMVEDQPGTFLAWRGTRAGTLEFTGNLSLRAAPAGRGTEACLQWTTIAPDNLFGAMGAWLKSDSPRKRVTEALHLLKQVLETGEIATIDGQPVGNAFSRHKLFQDPHNTR